MGKGIPKTNFGPTGLYVRFHNGTGVVSGYIVEQYGDNEYKVAQTGTETPIYVVQLAETTAAANTLTAGFATILTKPHGAAVERAKMIHTNLCYTTEGNTYPWSTATTSATGYSKISTAADAPAITSSNTVSVAENAVLSKALTSDQTVTWTITGGADAARFELNAATLRWLSNGMKDFETPNDSDTNNTYIVTVTATNATSGMTASQTITVTVTNVAD